MMAVVNILSCEHTMYTKEDKRSAPKKSKLFWMTYNIDGKKSSFISGIRRTALRKATHLGAGVTQQHTSSFTISTTSTTAEGAYGFAPSLKVNLRQITKSVF